MKAVMSALPHDTKYLENSHLSTAARELKGRQIGGDTYHVVIVWVHVETSDTSANFWRTDAKDTR
jgi:hypothetical protein